jgi:hypothetical protein
MCTLVQMHSVICSLANSQPTDIRILKGKNNFSTYIVLNYIMICGDWEHRTPIRKGGLQVETWEWDILNSKHKCQHSTVISVVYHVNISKGTDYFHLHSFSCLESSNLRIRVAIKHRMKDCGDCEEKDKSSTIDHRRPILWPADGSLYKFQAG